MGSPILRKERKVCNGPPEGVRLAAGFEPTDSLYGSHGFIAPDLVPHCVPALYRSTAYLRPQPTYISSFLLSSAFSPPPLIGVYLPGCAAEVSPQVVQNGPTAGGCSGLYNPLSSFQVSAAAELVT